MITGDDSHTVQLNRVKVCIRIAPNKTLNRSVLDILFLTFAAHSVTLINLLKASAEN